MLALLLTLSMAAAGLTGVVKDTSGGAVPGASVTIQTASGTEQQTVISGSDGRFSFDTVPPGAVLIVRAGGFAEQRQTVDSTSVEVTLQPPTILETVVVTPGRTEQRLGDTPASSASWLGPDTGARGALRKRSGRSGARRIFAIHCPRSEKTSGRWWEGVCGSARGRRRIPSRPDP